MLAWHGHLVHCKLRSSVCRLLALIASIETESHPKERCSSLTSSTTLGPINFKSVKVCVAGWAVFDSCPLEGADKITRSWPRSRSVQSPAKLGIELIGVRVSRWSGVFIVHHGVAIHTTVCQYDAHPGWNGQGWGFCIASFCVKLWCVYTLGQQSPPLLTTGKYYEGQRHLWAFSLKLVWLQWTGDLS